MAKRNNRGQISTKAVINNIKVNSLPSFSFGSNSDIIPYGEDNLYPQRIFQAISKSPTAKGCVKRLREFISGLGVSIGGDIEVNRIGETVNDLLSQCVKSYSEQGGFAIHFNFNIFGDITEMSFVDLRFIRKTKDCKQVVFDDWEKIGNYYVSQEDVIIDLYNSKTSKSEVIKFAKGAKRKFNQYKGQVLYWSKDYQIYPTSPLDSSSVSASYELEAQVYPYANIKNGFSANKIIKYPSMLAGEETIEDRNELGQLSIDNNGFYPADQYNPYNELTNSQSKLEKDLQSLHGSQNAGSSLVVEVPVGVSGEFKDFKMVEDLSPTNTDALFVNQNKKAENDILKEFTMPKILLGVSDNGMFNEASFNDAFDYKNSDTKGDRKIIERVFNSFLPNTVFGINSIEITPLNMRKQQEDV